MVTTTLLLASIGFFDELASGLPTAGAASLESAFALGVTGLTVAVFTAPQLVSLCVDSVLLLWAEQRRRGTMIALGLLAMAASLLGCVLAPSVAWFVVAFTVYSPGSTLACGLGQASLMDADPEHRERRMAQWTLAGELGDLAAPALLWVAQASGVGWRGAWVVTAFVLVLEATAIVLRPMPSGTSADEVAQLSENEEEGGSIREALASLLQHPQLFVWLTAVALCSLMDEIVAVLLALWLGEQGAPASALTVALIAFTLGGAVGLLMLERLLRTNTSRPLVMVSALGCAVAHVLAVWAPTVPLLAVALFAVGAFASAHYPLVQARAYRALPGRSGLVVAAGQLFAPIELALPLALGAFADRVSLPAALLCLLAQPLGILAIVTLAPQGPGAASTLSSCRRGDGGLGRSPQAWRFAPILCPPGTYALRNCALDAVRATRSGNSPRAAARSGAAPRLDNDDSRTRLRGRMPLS